ncbi:MAG: hypothetical protein KTR29_15305 [Rhodothermaceae bacterium]|nr:hypothetical protein [Rhodothermaceae bacterium]
MTPTRSLTGKTAIFLLAALFSFVFLFAGCTTKNDTPKVSGEEQALALNELFSNYVSGFTAGEISRQSPIVIQFSNPIVGSREEGSAISRNRLPSFEPAIQGSAVWRDRRTIEFTPSTPLDPGQAFEGSLDMTQFFDNVPDEVQQFDFQFWTRPRSFRIEINPLKATGNSSLQSQVLEGLIVTSDYEDASVIERLLTAKHTNESLKVTWDHSSDGLTHTFTISPIERQENGSELHIEWDSRSLDVDFKGEQTITVPPLQSFTYVSASSRLAPERSAVVHFSDPIDPNQNLDGLIRISDYDVRFTIEGSQVTVYPASTEQTFSGDITLQIEPGIRNVAGTKIQTRHEVPLQFVEIEPAVKLTGTGVIMPTGTHLPFSFEAVNLDSVEVSILKVYEENIAQFFQVNDIAGSNEINRVGKVVKTDTVSLVNTGENLKQWSSYAIDLSDLIQPEPGALYQVTIGFKRSFSLYPCTETEEEQDEDWYTRRNNPCKTAYYHNGRFIRRNVLASDIGMIAKRGSNDGVYVYVTDLKTTKPLNGVTLELLDYSQQEVGRSTTDASGMAYVETNSSPFFLIAKQGAQRGYLKIPGGQSLSISRFDVGGERPRAGMRGYIYGERGVWRPGDDIHLTFILDDSERPLPADHPVEFELRSPKGQVVDKAVSTESVNNFYAFQTRTESDAVTGTYTARVRVGGASFTKAVKVETIMPNRMKINMNFDGDYLTKDKDNNQASMDVAWLHGAVAKNLKANVTAVLARSSTSFESFDQYIFTDPSRNYSGETQTVFDEVIDENGHAEFSLDIATSEQAPGMLKANLTTKVFEPGGAFSIDQFSVPFHPYNSYVGLKLPATRYGRLDADKEHKVEIVTVDRDGNPVEKSDIRLDVYEIDWRWWWDRSGRQVTNYNAKQLKNPVSQDTISTNSEGKGIADFEVKFSRYARYLVRACEPGGHCSGQIVYIRPPYWWDRNNNTQPGGETMLTFTADKESYNVGETVTLNIPTPTEGRALVTLESATEILESHWVEAEKGTTPFTFTATDEMAPNIYASVSLLQPHAQTNNDLPIRLYGVIPIMVYDEATHLEPVIAMDEELLPEETATIRVSEEQGRAMTYTLAVVDEGLLDLTRFKTPNPWDHFFSRQALTTKTWDLFDHVLGASSMEYSSLLSIGGGDEGAEGDGTSKVNRFTPVVQYYGPFELERGETRSHDIDMPLYVGSVRTMVIAGAEGAFGAAEQATPVRQPVMLLGTLPRVLGPEEEVDFYLSVFAMNDQVGKVDVVLETSDLLTPTQGTRKSVSFPRAGEEVIAFPLKVDNAIGTATVKAVATSGSERAEYTFDIEVRPPNPYLSTAKDTSLAPGATWTYQPELIGIAGTNSGSMEISSLPPMNLGNRMRYLIRYPHGCIEQTTSRAFPQLYLPSLVEMPEDRKKEIERNIRSGIRRINRFQSSGGWLSYWPGRNYISDWGTNYAGHFMIEAQRLGYTLPDDFMPRWLKFQKKSANDWVMDEDTYRTETIQAYRLYLLALAGEPQLGAMNRFREGVYGKDVDKWMLAAAYQLAGQPEVARTITEPLTWEIPDYKELAYSYGSHVRDKAIILQTLTVMERSSEATPLVEELSYALNRRSYMSTQTTAYALLSMMGYATLQDAELDMTYQSGGVQQKITTPKPYYEVDLDLEQQNPSPYSVTNDTDITLYVRANLHGTPPIGDETAASNGIKLDVVYKNLDDEVISPERLAQGTDFFAEVTVTNTSGQWLRELALTQIFPSGWEIHRSREDINAENTYARPDFQDIRDDRVYTYFNMSSQSRYTPNQHKQTFRILLNASYRGRFYLPAVSIETMYDEEIFARTEGMWVEVVDE